MKDVPQALSLEDSETATPSSNLPEEVQRANIPPPPRPQQPEQRTFGGFFRKLFRR
jgi:hypothetical protein